MTIDWNKDLGERHTHTLDLQIKDLKNNLKKAKEVINNRNSVIRQLVSTLKSYGIEVTNLGELEDEVII